MCVIVVHDKSLKDTKRLTKERFAACWAANPHMGGIMYTVPNSEEVYITKHKTLQEMYEAYERVPNDAINTVLHFRISTSGYEFNNCHPFTIKRKRIGTRYVPTLAMCHNGIIHGLGNRKYSDTHMVARYLEGLTHRPEYKRKDLPYDDVKDFVGYGNKLVFLDGTKVGNGQSPQLTIINKPQFTRYEEALYSNMNWTWQDKTYPQPKASYSYVNNGKGYGKNTANEYFKDSIWSKKDVSDTEVANAIDDSKAGKKEYKPWWHKEETKDNYDERFVTELTPTNQRFVDGGCECDNAQEDGPIACRSCGFNKKHKCYKSAIRGYLD